MERETIVALLEAVASGEKSTDEALETLADLPFRDLEHTKLDFHRALRSGLGEVVYGAGKSVAQLREILREHCRVDARVLVTRMTPEQERLVSEEFPGLCVDAGCAAAFTPNAVAPLGRVAVLSAGTSDAKVAREAAVTARFFSLEAQEINDVGVAGLPRLLAIRPQLQDHDVLIVVAGMEGALPSVVAGLTAAPVIAVPTSVGYGAAFQGMTALLGMLVSCSPGITVVNIDNGFGAAFAAAKFVRHLRRGHDRTK